MHAKIYDRTGAARCVRSLWGTERSGVSVTNWQNFGGWGVWSCVQIMSCCHFGQDNPARNFEEMLLFDGLSRSLQIVPLGSGRFRRVERGPDIACVMRPSGANTCEDTGSYLSSL